MKRSRKLLLAAAVIAALAAVPIGAFARAQTGAGGTSSSEVKCVVEPVYTFTVPADAWLQYPNNRMALGQFCIGELLLAGGETLSVVLTPGALQTSNGEELPYIVSFNPPEAFDQGASGQACDILLEIDADAFQAASTGAYNAKLLFSVVSSPSEKVVWQGTVAVAAEKAQGSAFGKNVPPFNIGELGQFVWYAAAAAAAISTTIVLFIKIKKKKCASEQAGFRLN